MMKNRYIVFIQDEWNNLWWMGEYCSLKDALPEINNFLEVYDIKIEELLEYSSTFGSTFDTEIETSDGEIIMIRGFIL